MSSYQVGQIVYVVLKKKMAVQPFRIVEIITKKTLADRKSTRLNSSHVSESRMPSSA